jgi:serine/threonine-protein kinase
LGCALYRLLTGKSPYFQADGAVAVMSAHLTQPPPRVTEIAPWLPPQIDWVIAKAMAKDPAQRFSSARELAEAASQAIYGTTAPHRGAATSMSTSPWTSNPNPAPAHRTYAAPTASSGPTSPPMQGYYAMPAGPFGVQPSRPRSKAFAAVAAVVLLLAGGVTAWALTSGSDSGSQASTTASNSQSTSTTPSTATTVPNSALSGLLLPVAQFADLLGVPELVVSRTFTAIQDDSSPAVDLKECISASLPGQQLVYQDSDWKAAVEQFLVPPGGVGSFSIQAVIAFADAAAAQKVERDQRETWTQCAGKTMITTANAQPTQQTFGSVESVDDQTIALPNSHPGGFTCQRALGARNNIVIDVLACRIGVVHQGVDILKQIATKIST